MIQYMIGKRTRRVVLGLLSGLDPSKAYDMAKDILARVPASDAIQPPRAQARIKAAETFSALLPRFLGVAGEAEADRQGDATISLESR